MVVRPGASGLDFQLRTGGPTRRVAFHVVDAETKAPIEEYWTGYDRPGHGPRRVIVRGSDRDLSLPEGAPLSWKVHRPGYEPVSGTQEDFTRIEMRSGTRGAEPRAINTWIADVELRPMPGAAAIDARAAELPARRYR